MKTPPMDPQIPCHWSPEQALAVWELLSQLADLVWAQYEAPLTELLAGPDNPYADDTCPDSNQLDLFDPNDPDDPIPF